MVVIFAGSDYVVIIAVAINDHATIAWYLTDDARHVELISRLKLRRPFEDEYYRVGGLNIDGVIKRNDRIYLSRDPSPVNRYLVSDGSCGFGVTLDYQATSLIFHCPVNEHQLHNESSRPRASVFIP